jgi:hypothetical protein
MSNSSPSDPSTEEGNKQSDNTNKGTEIPRDEAGNIQFDELPREEKMWVIFRNSDEAYHYLRREWEEDEMQMYFVLYSFGMVGVMMFLMSEGRTKLLIGAFALYVIIAIPTLYIYEEEGYFE